MWPSMSCWTERGSQLGIWPATAVIKPKLNEPSPSSTRMRRRAASRNLRIRRRRPFETGAGLLRLRPNKRRILALDAEERLLRRSVRAACLLDRDQHGCGPGQASGEEHGAVLRAARERPGSRGAPTRGDPGFVGAAGRRRRKALHDQDGIAVGPD